MNEQDVCRRVLDRVSDGVYFVDSRRRITYWNAAAERISGFSAGEVVGRFCQDNLLRHVDAAGTELCRHGCPLHGCLFDGRVRESQTVYLHHKAGHRVAVEVRVVPFFDDAGKVSGAMEVFSERTPRADSERRISELRRRLALDALTGLSNRDALERTLRTRLFDLRHGGAAFGLLFVDIDRFKRVNDTRGHAVGDLALQLLARTLRENLRPDDAAGRWGGEEFVVLLADADAAGLRAVSDKLLMLIRSSEVRAPGGGFGITISIGATLARPDDSVESLIERADRLMYRSKGEGRDRVTIG